MGTTMGAQASCLLTTRRRLRTKPPRLVIPIASDHAPKHVTPGDTLEIPGAVLKWYGLYPIERPIPDEITLLGRSTLKTTPLEAHGLGFVVLHRCGNDFYFLIVCTWRNSNEMWQTRNRHGSAFLFLRVTRPLRKPGFPISLPAPPKTFVAVRRKLNGKSSKSLDWFCLENHCPSFKVYTVNQLCDFLKHSSMTCDGRRTLSE